MSFYKEEGVKHKMLIFVDDLLRSGPQRSHHCQHGVSSRWCRPQCISQWNNLRCAFYVRCSFEFSSSAVVLRGMAFDSHNFWWMLEATLDCRTNVGHFDRCQCDASFPLLLLLSWAQHFIDTNIAIYFILLRLKKAFQDAAKRRLEVVAECEVWYEWIDVPYSRMEMPRESNLTLCRRTSLFLCSNWGELR